MTLPSTPDVTVYLVDEAVLRCDTCRLYSEGHHFETLSAGEMLSHLKEHRMVGDHVPEGIEDLLL